MFLRSLEKFLNTLAIWLIDFYKLVLSPFIGNSCRFYPTCSQYARVSFSYNKFYVSFFITIIRILKCNSLFNGGYKPARIYGRSE